MCPAICGRDDADSFCVKGSCENVIGSGAPDSDDPVPWSETTKEKLQRAHLVAAADRRVEVVALYPEIIPDRAQVLDRSWQSA